MSTLSLRHNHAPATSSRPTGLVARLQAVDLSRWFTPAAPLVGTLGNDRDAVRLHRDLQAARDHAQG